MGKFTYTERADGGAVMLEAVSKCKTGDTTALGSFHGFELLVEKNFMGVNYLILRGKTEYAMYYKMLGTVRSKEIPFHFLHVQNTNQVIENIYSVVKAEEE